MRVADKRHQLEPLGASCVHLCVDMQRMFAEQTEWHTPWMERVLPAVERLAAARPSQTIFTRFIPAARPGEGTGRWKYYFERWSSMTLEALPPGMADLVPDLARLTPPAEVFDKPVYSPWWDGRLHRQMQGRGIDTLVISGAETDVCVLATTLGAVDMGYRVVIPTDALCSSSDRTHEALMALYRERFSAQIEATTVDEIIDGWR
jgi:nicotinamidase-related amidase